MGRKSKPKRKCSLCGEKHKRELCPIIKKKLEKYDKSKKRNFFMANVLLECIHKEISFQTLLKEFAELVLEWNDFPQTDNVIACLDTSIEFFAASLDCNPSKFFKPTKDTIHELMEIISKGEGFSNPNFCYGKLGEIRLTIKNIPEIINLEDEDFNYLYMYIKKFFYKEKEPDYHLYISVVEPRDIHFQNMRTCLSSRIELAFESEGELKDYFDMVYDEHWTDIAIYTPFSDDRFDIWISRLIVATKNHLVKWKKLENSSNFKTIYGDTRINILFDPDEKVLACLYIRVGDGKGIKFLWEEYYDWVRLITKLESSENMQTSEKELEEPLLENNPDIKESIEKLHDLFTLIIKSKQNLPDIFEREKDVEIKYTDVIVSSASLICNTRTHTILPYIGIVKLFTPDNEILNYQIYVGYCKECGRYYVFERDYTEMIKAGTPLCNIVDKNKPRSKYSIPFRYKSQSILNAMGYTVDRNIDLSSNKRHKILVEALQKEFFSIHDLLDFLNWLVTTRKTQKRYSDAVEKWNEDIDFIENYKKDERKAVHISSIYKRYCP